MAFVVSFVVIIVVFMMIVGFVVVLFSSAAFILSRTVAFTELARIGFIVSFVVRVTF